MISKARSFIYKVVCMDFIQKKLRGHNGLNVQCKGLLLSSQRQKFGLLPGSPRAHGLVHLICVYIH